MNHVTRFKGQPSWGTLKAIKWYERIPPDYIDQSKINKSTVLSNKTSTTESCYGSEDQTLEHLIFRTRFFIFVLNNKMNNFFKSGDQAVNINHWLGGLWWLLLLFETVSLFEGLCISNPCRFEFSVFWVFSGNEPTNWGLTVLRSDQLS